MQSMKRAPLLPALAKIQSEDQEIKKKAFSAFWPCCSENRRNLGARMCIDRSGVLQAAASVASSSPSSSCTEPRGKTQHHLPPLKKQQWNEARHGYPTTERLLNKHSSRKPALQTGLTDLLSATSRLRFWSCVRRGPSLTCQQVLFTTVSGRIVFRVIPSSVSSAWICHAAYGRLQTCSASSYLQMTTEPLVLAWGGTPLQYPIPAWQQFGLIEALGIYIPTAWQQHLHHLFW